MAVLGPPAAGKTALCALLATRFGVPHISAGGLLAAALQNPESSAGKHTNSEVMISLIASKPCKY